MKRIHNRKTLLLLAALVLVVTVSVGGTIAYLIDSTESVTNTFSPASAPNNVEESFDGAVKNDVKVKNTSTSDVKEYIRVKVLFTWQDANGNILPDTPAEGTDYSLTWETGTGYKWFYCKDDGFYYFADPVDAGYSTDVLFTNCKQLKKAPVDGYALHVEIISQSIQAEPTTAVVDSWKVSVNGTTISK